MDFDITDILDKDFGIKAKKRLADLKMTQAELAGSLDITAAYLNELLSGKKKSLEMREKILHILYDEE